MKKLLIALVFVVSGCSTIDSKSYIPERTKKLGDNKTVTIEAKESQWGNPYSGTSKAIDDVECAFVVGSMTFGIGLGAWVIDLGSSVIADTIILPLDLIIQTDVPRDPIVSKNRC